MAEIFRPPFFQVESAAGIPLSGAKLYFYATGTTTPITVYQDVGLTTPHASPVVADANGTFPSIYLGSNTYKIALYTSADVLVKTVDNINSTSSGSTVLDGTFRVQNTTDPTKQIAFSAAGITTGTTRTATMPDKNGTLAMTSDIPAAGVSATQSPGPINLALVASVAGSALTIALKGVDGNDPSSSNKVYIPFRNVTATSGVPEYLTIQAATSVVISSGSTLGMTSAVAATLAIVAFNDGSTLRLGVINPTAVLTDGIASSTAEGGAGAADSAGVIYTGTAVTSKAMSVIGYAVATEATAGTWATAPATLKTTTDGELAAVVGAVITPWVAYTPTFTGFGTATAINIRSRRVGDTLQVQGTFTTGTCTGVEARITLGFNGTSANVTSAGSTKISTLQIAGQVAQGQALAGQIIVLIEQSVTYMTAGLQTGAAFGLAKANATAPFFNSVAYSLQAEIPIAGW